MRNGIAVFTRIALDYLSPDGDGGVAVAASTSAA